MSVIRTRWLPIHWVVGSWNSSMPLAPGRRFARYRILPPVQEAFEKGFGDFDAIDASPRFASLRQAPRSQEHPGRYRH